MEKGREEQKRGEKGKEKEEKKKNRNLVATPFMFQMSPARRCHSWEKIPLKRRGGRGERKEKTGRGVIFRAVAQATFCVFVGARLAVTTADPRGEEG